MQVRHRPAVHLQRHHRVRLHGLPDRMAADEVRRLRRGRRVVAVGHHVSGRRPWLGEAEDVGQAHALPHARPHRAVLPLKSRRLRIVEAPAVARALEGDGLRHLLHALEIVESQRQRIVHLAVHFEHELGWVHLRAVVVVADEERLVRRDRAREVIEPRLEVEGPRAPDDQLLLARYGRRGRLRQHGHPAAQEGCRRPHVDDEAPPGHAVPRLKRPVGICHGSFSLEITRRVSTRRPCHAWRIILQP